MGGVTSKVMSLKQDLRDKHFVVTGANTGIGFATAREIAKMGGTVTMACRSEARGKAALEKLRQEALEKPVKEGVGLQGGLEDVDVKLEVLDLGSLQSVIDFAERMRSSGTKIDVLVNNAGVLGSPERQETADGFELHIGVNHFGHHLLSRLLEPSIVDGGRTVFLTSLVHEGVPGAHKTRLEWDNINFEKPDSFETYEAYGRSKLANILDAKEFGKRLAPRGIITYAVHPGMVATELARSAGTTEDSPLALRLVLSAKSFMRSISLSPIEGSLTTLKCSVDPELAKAEISGKYWADMKETQPSALASDPENPPRYWAVTEEMLETKLGKKAGELI